MSPEGQAGSDVVEATLPLVGDAAIDLALERVQIGLVGTELVLELGHAQAQSAVVAEERRHLLLELHQPRGSMSLVLDVLQAERVEHEVERLALVVGDTVDAWVHGRLLGWMDAPGPDLIRSASGASRSEPRPLGQPISNGCACSLYVITYT